MTPPRPHAVADARRSALLSLAVVLGLRRVAPLVPASLVAVAFGVAVVNLFDLADHGVAIVGHIESGLPRSVCRTPEPRDYLAPAATAVGSCSSASPRASARPRPTPPGTATRSTPTESWSASARPTSAPGCASGMVVNGSLSKTAVNGGRAPLADVRDLRRGRDHRHAAVPHQPVRGPARGDAGGGRDRRRHRARRHRRAARLYRLSTRRLGKIYGHAARPDFIAAIAAMFGVLIFDTLPGLFIGIGVSLLLLLYRASRPHVAELGAVPGATAQFADRRHPENLPARHRRGAGGGRPVLRQRRRRARPPACRRRPGGHPRRGARRRDHAVRRRHRRVDARTSWRRRWRRRECSWPSPRRSARCATSCPPPNRGDGDLKLLPDGAGRRRRGHVSDAGDPRSARCSAASVRPWQGRDGDAARRLGRRRRWGRGRHPVQAGGHRHGWSALPSVASAVTFGEGYHVLTSRSSARSSTTDKRRSWRPNEWEV